MNTVTVLNIVTIIVINVVQSEKVFKSVPNTVKTYENDTVLLPCYIDEESKQRVRWYKGNELLGDSADPHHLLPPRTRMHANFSLQIDALKSQDTADYTCEVWKKSNRYLDFVLSPTAIEKVLKEAPDSQYVATKVIRPDPWGPIKQTHSIEVQHSPTIRTIPDDGFVEVRKGDYVDIGCETTGTPAPTVLWRKNGETMALLEHRSRIRFKAEHRLLAGVYQCVASNGVGDTVTANIRVVIHDAPVVTAARSFVHTAEGLRAALAATLEFAVPPARTNWYRDGRPVRTDERVIVMVQENVHQLIFRPVRKSDLGNYTFRAENKLGMADVSFKLTGVPNAATFKVDSALNKATSTSFKLVWEVDSYSTLIEYNLWLRPYYGRLIDADGFTTETPTNTWSKIVVPGDSSDGPIHSATYTVRGLTPSTVYEAIVTSRNQFGWSKQSAILHFATEPGTGRRPSTSDYSDITPLLEEPESEEELNITNAHIFKLNESSGVPQTHCSVAILILVWSVYILS